MVHPNLSDSVCRCSGLLSGLQLVSLLLWWELMIKFTLVKKIIQSFKSENSCICMLLHHHSFNHLPLFGYFRCFSLTTPKSYIVYILFLCPVVIVMLANPIIFYQAGKSGTQSTPKIFILKYFLSVKLLNCWVWLFFFSQGYWNYIELKAMCILLYSEIIILDWKWLYFVAFWMDLIILVRKVLYFCSIFVVFCSTWLFL